MKKVPLYLGIFLIMVWGASAKIRSEIKSQSIKKEKVCLFLKKYQQTHKTIQLKEISWEEFYSICQPELSEVLTDAELRKVYTEFRSVKEDK